MFTYIKFHVSFQEKDYMSLYIRMSPEPLSPSLLAPDYVAFLHVAGPRHLCTPGRW